MEPEIDSTEQGHPSLLYEREVADHRTGDHAEDIPPQGLP